MNIFEEAQHIYKEQRTAYKSVKFFISLMKSRDELTLARSLILLHNYS